MMIEKNKLCYAWYKSPNYGVDLYFCVPKEIGEKHSTCVLYSGTPPHLRRKGEFTDVCTADLVPVNAPTPSEAAWVEEFNKKL